MKQEKSVYSIRTFNIPITSILVLVLFNSFYSYGNKIEISKIQIANQIVNTEEKLSNNLLFDGQKLNVTHDKNDLAFYWEVENSEKNAPSLFRYQLENFDENWIETSGKQSAFYSNLPPGEYNFTVKKISKSGKDEEASASLNICIQTPWYLSNLAFLGFFSLFGFLFYNIRNKILEGFELKNQLKLEQLELEKMQDLDKIKEQFFTNISHEFRTPLTLIMGPLKTILTRKHDKKDLFLLRTMERNSEYLYKLTNQILEISRIDAGKEELQASVGDISKLINSTAQKFRALAEENSINYQIILPRKPIIILYDSEKIEKVLINLISNAFKYTEQGGKITVKLIETSQTITISIKDNGETIPEEEKAQIFERYYKSKSKNSSLSSGIGLAVSKQLVELHKGTIRCTSQKEPTAETTFSIELLKGQKHLSRDQIIAPENKKRSNDLPAQYLTGKNLNGNNGTILKPSPVSEENDRSLILIVEDNDDMRNFICSLLSEKYRIIEAPIGKIGYETAVKLIPEIIISDVMMPEINGFDLSQKIKNNPATAHVSVILLTAKSSPENISEGFLMGAESYITKPFDPEFLKIKVDNLLQTRERLKRHILENSTLQKSPETTFHSKLDEEFIKNVIEEIEKRISDPGLKIEELAKAVGFSKSQFYRKMKGLLGKSGNEFIRLIRMKKAAQLLQNSDLRITEITYNVGFNDLEYFRTCFKKQFKMLPTDYRKNFSAPKNVPIKVGGTPKSPPGPF